MRILSLTAGAAGMYCGSCFRDNALAAELMARGHEVTLQPVYTPTLVDETNVSRGGKVLLGGLNIYLQQQSALFRKLPRFLDRLWDSPRLITMLASGGGTTDPRLLGELTVSTLEGTNGVLRRQYDKLVEWVRSEPLPDVINIPNSLLIAMAAPLREAVRRPIFCTLSGEELFIDGLTPPYRERTLALIRQQVPGVDRFIAVSDYCASFMSDYLAIPRGRIDVVPLGISMEGYELRAPGLRAPDSRLQAPGTEPGHAEPGARSPEPFRIGYFARVVPEKGLHVLADAYVQFRRRIGDVPVRLEAAGYMAASQAPYLKDVEAKLARAGLGAEFRYHGAIDRVAKLAFLRELDLLSVPATYDEPKGLFLLEAMAAGVPVVQPRRGAFIEVVQKTGGGILVEPGGADGAGAVDALADGLYRLWSHRDERLALAQQAFDGVRAHYTVAQSAARLLDVYSAQVHAYSFAS